MKNFDIKKLDSMTKYPSIPTYHQIAGQNKLFPNVTDGINYDGQIVEMSEKVNGTNTREVFVIENNKVNYFIGSRDMFVYSSENDTIINGEKGGMDIISTIKPIADRIKNIISFPDGIFVCFHELYGGKIQDYAQYTNSEQFGVKVFDMFYIPMNEVEDVMNKDITNIARWRDKMNQPYFNTAKLREMAQLLGFECTPVRHLIVDGSILPKTLEEMYLFLMSFRKTVVGIDASGISEGIVARTSDRKVISKIRFEDYEKTLNLRGKNRKLLEKELNITTDSNRANFIKELLRFY